MKKGKCIYCNEEKELNEEHAFPQFLLQIHEGAPEWIIDEHLCEKCNRKLGKLYKILKMRGPIGHTWNLIKSEFGQENENQQSLRYNQKCYSLEPDRIMAPIPFLGNLIVSSKLLVVESSENNILSNSIEHSLDPIEPQIILTLYAKWQQLKKTRDETAVNFDKLDIIPCFEGSRPIYWIGNGTKLTPRISDSPIVVPRLWTKDSYFVRPHTKYPPNATADFPFPHTYVFSQKATEYFFDRPKNFQSDFLSIFDRINWIQSDLTIIIDGKNKKHGKAKPFMKCLKSDGHNINIVDKQTYPINATYPNNSRIKIRYVTDGNAKSYIERALAKIGFHCFLYHYPDEFNGHESIFDGIKTFIFKENTSNNFVTEYKDVAKNPIYSSNTHFHNISFFRDRQNIGCRITLFTGLWMKPFSFYITLSGKIENWNVHPDKTERVPFYVSSKSERKRRVYPPNESGIIIEPSLKETHTFGIKHN